MKDCFVSKNGNYLIIMDYPAPPNANIVFSGTEEECIAYTENPGKVKDHYYSSKQVRLKSNDNPMFDFVYAVVWMDLVDEKGEPGDTHVAVKCSNWPSLIRYVPVDDVIFENPDKTNEHDN